MFSQIPLNATGLMGRRNCPCDKEPLPRIGIYFRVSFMIGKAIGYNALPHPYDTRHWAAVPDYVNTEQISKTCKVEPMKLIPLAILGILVPRKVQIVRHFIGLKIGLRGLT